MSLDSATSINQYTGNNTTATYSYSFKIFEEGDLKVTVMNTSGVESVLALTTDYTVIGEGESGGGSITLTGGNLATGYILTIRRLTDIVQETDVRNQSAYFPEVIEDQFDKLVMIDQQQQNEIDLAVKLPESLSNSGIDLNLPTDFEDNPEATIMVNANGDGFAFGPTATEVSAAEGYAEDAANSVTTAQRWATETSDTVIDANTLVDSNEFSAKEYAQGTQASTGGSSKNWAQQTGADVTGAAANSRSAKAWAQSDLTGATLGGSSKDWAQNTSSTVDGTLYSSKEYATGIQTRGLAGGGSSKDWAQYTGGTVDNAEYSAKYYATAAATSAAQAAVNAGASLWNDVVYLTSASSPYSIVDASAGTMYVVDTTGGNVVVNLPQISGLTLTASWAVGIKKESSDTNTVTINRNGTDTIDGATSKTLNFQYQGCTLIPDVDGSPDDWTALDFNRFAPQTVSRAMVSDANGNLTTSATTAAEIALLSGVTTQPIGKGIIDAKGDLIVGTADNTYARFAVGTDGYVLKADSSQPTGLIWSSVNSNLSIVSKTANYTATITDDLILCNDTSGSFTITLFAASGNSGKQLKIKKTNSTSTNQITIDANASETIDGSLTTTINSQYEQINLICDGSNWHILNRNINSTSVNITPTTTNLGFTAGTNTLEYWRNGDKLFGKGFITYSSGTGSGSNFSVTIPESLTIDTTKLGSTSGTLGPFGGWSWYDDAGSSSTLDDNFGPLAYDSTTTIGFRVPNTSNRFVTNVMTTNDSFSYNFCLPITNWKG